jgi:hypothetical protein
MVRLRSTVQRWRTELMVRRAVRSIDGDLELLLTPARTPPPTGPWVWLASLSLGPVELPDPLVCASRPERVAHRHGRRERRAVRTGDAPAD